MCVGSEGAGRKLAGPFACRGVSLIVLCVVCVHLVESVPSVRTERSSRISF